MQCCPNCSYLTCANRSRFTKLKVSLCVFEFLRVFECVTTKYYRN